VTLTLREIFWTFIIDTKNIFLDKVMGFYQKQEMEARFQKKFKGKF